MVLGFHYLYGIHIFGHMLLKHILFYLFFSEIQNLECDQVQSRGIYFSEAASKAQAHNFQKHHQYFRISIQTQRYSLIWQPKMMFVL